jgi:ATP-dependent DNA helicase DinG
VTNAPSSPDRPQVPTVDDVLGPASPLARRLAGYEHREGQLEMARSVMRALSEDRHLFVEAGTGTGKTLAYLVPAVLSGRRVVISTATHALQEQIFEKDLPLVREVLHDHGVDFRAALMKGLSNYLCRRRFDERMRSGETVSPVLARIERWALETETGDRAELVDLSENAPGWRDVQSGTDTRIGAGCTYYDECFVTRMRRDAELANIIVVNHHLFFADLALKTAKPGGGYGGAIPPYDAVVFDEAHQIESVATDFFGVRVSSSRVDALVRDTRRAFVAARTVDSLSMGVLDALETAGAELFRAWGGRGAGTRDARDEGRRLLAAADWTPARRDAGARFDAALEALFAFARARDEHEGLALISRRCAELRADLAKISASDVGVDRHWEPDEDDEPFPGEPSTTEGFDGGVTWIDARERTVSLGASPVDLAPMLRRNLFERVPSVICTSATLATAAHVDKSFHFAKGRLGAQADTAELVVPSPFDFATRSAFYVAEDLPAPGEPGFDAACAARVAELVGITGGGAFVLCTSNRAMRAIHGALDGVVRGPLLVQGEAPKHVLLDQFRASSAATLVATMSFWEGVDVPGHALRLVIIDKIPFAVPTDPIVSARSAKIQSEGGNPFSQYAVPSAAITLKQGFGRLIRTRKDRGIVALLDKRAAKRGYGKSLLASLPPARRVRTIGEVEAAWDELSRA